MASNQVKEWTGLQHFPVATQSALHNLLGKLRTEKVDTLTVLVLGKGGVGKSSTVNSMLGERVAVVSTIQSETMRPLSCSRSRAGFTLNIIDTPGLIEGGWVNDQALDIIRRFLLNKTIDVVLYVDRLDGYRVDNLDKQVMKAISQSFGPQIWQITLLVLTHAQLSPPDGVAYPEYVEKRAAALQTTIRQVSGLPKAVSQVILVENSGRCNTNAGAEKILPDGKVWLPHIFESIVEVAMSENQSIFVDKNLIEGPNANQRGKLWIPLLLVTQFFLVVRPILRAIQKDIQHENENRPAWEIRAEQYARSASSLRGRKRFSQNN